MANLKHFFSSSLVCSHEPWKIWSRFSVDSAEFSLTFCLSRDIAHAIPHFHCIYLSLPCSMRPRPDFGGGDKQHWNRGGGGGAGQFPHSQFGNQQFQPNFNPGMYPPRKDFGGPRKPMQQGMPMKFVKKPKEEDMSKEDRAKMQSLRAKCPGSNLSEPEWDGKLEPFNKDFNKIHENNRKRTPEEISQWRKTMEITVKGVDVPSPHQEFKEANFSPMILNELAKQGFSQPTPIQAQGWPIALSGRDLLGIAMTGSGKTLAYMLPGIIHINNQRPLSRGEGPIVLVLAPTRELAQQIQSVAKDFGSYAKPMVRNTCIFGGSPRGPQCRDLERGVEIGEKFFDD